MTTESFQMMREAKLRAEKRVQELEEELKLVQRQLKQFQVKHMTRLHRQRKRQLDASRREYEAIYGPSRDLLLLEEGEDTVDS